MAGNIKKAIDTIVEQRSKGDPFLIKTTKTKLILKGINTEKYTASSEDDPAVLQKLIAIAAEFNIKI